MKIRYIVASKEVPPPEIHSWVNSLLGVIGSNSPSRGALTVSWEILSGSQWHRGTGFADDPALQFGLTQMNATVWANATRSVMVDRWRLLRTRVTLDTWDFDLTAVGETQVLQQCERDYASLARRLIPFFDGVSIFPKNINRIASAVIIDPNFELET